MPELNQTMLQDHPAIAVEWSAPAIYRHNSDARHQHASWWCLPSRSRLPLVLHWNFLLPEIVKYSPGRILLKKQIKWCFENNIDLFDFGPGEFEYKKQWANDFKYYFKILEPKSFLGLIYYIFYKIKKVLY